MDKRYENGRIYTIRCRYDDTLIYVGSTIEKYLSKRMSKHRYSKSCEVCKYINDDWDNWYIELYEDYPCDNRHQLSRREGEIIRQIGTLNKRIEGRTNKEYIEDNKEKYLEYRKKYNKEYYQDNRDIILERHRVRSVEKETCERCGFIGQKQHIKRHQQSSKCLNYNVIYN